jgi:hypothetical protein
MKNVKLFSYENLFLEVDHILCMYYYEELLHKHKACSLHLACGRLQNIATETLTIIHGQCPVYCNDFIHKRESVYSLRYKNVLTTPNTRTVTYGTNCFRPLAAKVWDSLPENVRETVCFNDFKMFIKTLNGFTCKCEMCK